MIKRLQQIAVEKILNIQVKCNFNETVIDKNFAVIIECLKNLDNYKENSDKQIKIVEEKNNKLQKDLANLRETLNRFRENQQKFGGNISKQNSSQQYDSNILDEIRRKLKEESQKNHKNNIQNLKDINILLSDIKDLKQQIANIKNQFPNTQRLNQDQSKTLHKQDLENIRIVQNQMQKQLEDTRKLQQQIQKLKNKDQQFQKQIKNLINNSNLIRNINNSQNNNQNFYKNDLNDLKERLKIIQKSFLKQDLNQQKINNIINNIIDDKLTNLNDWRREIQQKLADFQESLNELNNKSEERVLSKKSSRKENNSLYTQRFDKNKFDIELVDIDNKIQKLEGRMDQFDILLRDLQKALNSKATEQKKQEKFPNINTNRNLKNKIIREKDISSRDIIINKVNSNDLDKKLLDLKVQLQQWIKQLLQNRNNNGNRNLDESIKELELKIQEIKINLEKKADQQGVKKYLTFLQNKINQIFLFLSQPESQDALIARKGWNCLSCTKKLEKYKGRLGQHLNWNNLTTANYSPPRVGFTQTYKSSERTKFVSMAGQKKQFGYQEQLEKND